MATIKTILNRKKLTNIQHALESGDKSVLSQMEDMRENLEAYADKLEVKRNKELKKRNKNNAGLAQR